MDCGIEQRRSSDAADLADKFQRLAIADGRAVNLAYAHMIHMTSTYRLGDLINAEHTFREGEKFFTFPAFEQRPGFIAQTYGNAARIAWILGNFWPGATAYRSRTLRSTQV